MMSGNEPTVNKVHGGKLQSDEMDLQSMMRDPKYWRDKDPSFITKVAEGFEKIYSN